MEQNKTFDMSNLPPFITRDMGPLVYDLSEIEHQFYLFDRRCVGCVVLFCTRPLKPEVVGNISLDGETISGSFFIEIDVPMQGKVPILAIPIRGRVGYGKEYTLRISGFLDINGGAIDAVDIPLTTKPYPVKNEKYAAHDEIAANAAREGMVLLKNEGNVLPLAPDSVLNLFGEGVTNYRIGTTGAGKINPRFAYGLREAVKETSGFLLNPELDALYTTPTNIEPSEEVLLRAKAQSDAAIIVLTRGAGENVDGAPLPGEYYLTSDEERMIEAICRVFDETVVILNTGYPIDMRWVEKYGIKVVLYTGFAGQASAEVLLEILDGRTNPSGKLPDTWALDYYDIPASANFYVRKENENPILSEDDVWVDTCYEEGIYVGYRYFETFGKEAAYPFGFGLSYTTFALSDLSCTRLKHNVQIFATVTNTGTASGKEVVQVYAKLPGTLQEQPARQLAAFAKTRLLPPGESESLTLVVDEKSLSTFCVSENTWILEKGGIEFYVGTDVHSAALCGEITQSETVVLSRSEYHLPPPVSFEEISPNAKAFPVGGLTRIREGAKGLTDTVCRKEVFPPKCNTKAAESLIAFGELKANPSLLNSFLAQMSDAELCRLNMMYGHGWGMDGKGEAGRLAPIEKYGIPAYACADGNCGVNVYNPNIGMPTSVVVCATFNGDLAKEVGRVIGEEAAENGIQMILAPAMNIHRNPLCGRHAEYFSEDPYLAGKMAAGYVQGLHEAGISDSVKHFAANNCETARKRNHSLVGERALREIYLRAFEVLINSVKPDTIMTSYNALNGSMCGSDPILLEGILRDDFGFDGFVMTDWTSYDTVDMVEAVNAGVSWLTPGENDGSRVTVLEKAVAEGRITRDRLIENARRVFAVLIKRGV